MKKITPFYKLTTLLICAAAYLTVTGGFFAQAQILTNTNGLVGYWTGNGNAYDSSANANNGTFSGAYASGPFGQAFNLSNGYVTIPHIPAYDFTGGFSVGFWFFGATSGDSNDVFVGDDNGGGTQNKWFVAYSGGSFYFHMNGSHWAWLYSNPVSLAANTWHQCTLTFDGTSTCNFYLDGTSIGTQSDSGPIPIPTAPLTIGYGEPGYEFYGLISNVVLYNRALSASEASSLGSDGNAQSPIIILETGSNLIANGGFETGDFTGWTLTNAVAGSDVGVNSREVHSGLYAAIFGALSSDFDSISQTLATTPGSAYQFDFWLANEAGAANGGAQFQVSWNGTPILSETDTTSFSYRQETSTVIATSASTVVTFSGLNNPSWYYLDDISVSAGQTVSGLTPTSAILNGMINPNNLATAAQFEISTDAGLAGASITSGTAIGSGTTAVSVSAPVNGLTPDTTYYYRIEAVYAGGTVTGNIQQFVTLSSSPSVTVTSATMASLQAGVDPKGTDTQVYYIYGTTTSYGSSTPPQDIGSGTSAVLVSTSLTGLTQDTTYYYQIVITSSSGTFYGQGQQFSKLTAPLLTTTSATTISTASGVLNDEVNPEGNDTQVYYQYGTTTGYGSTTPSHDIGSGSTTVLVSALLTGLSPDTTYYYRLVTTGSAGTFYGPQQTIVTEPSWAMLTFTATALLQSPSITLGGNDISIAAPIQVKITTKWLLNELQKDITGAGGVFPKNAALVASPYQSGGLTFGVTSSSDKSFQYVVPAAELSATASVAVDNGNLEADSANNITIQSIVALAYTNVTTTDTFTLYGLMTCNTTDTAPSSLGVYKQTNTIKVPSFSGGGVINSSDAAYNAIITGNFSATGGSSLNTSTTPIGVNP